MEIVTKVMEKSWKSHGNLLVKMCTNPVYLQSVLLYWYFELTANAFEILCGDRFVLVEINILLYCFYGHFYFSQRHFF